jgi:6-methylsalicylate decarboxylase
MSDHDLDPTGEARRLDAWRVPSLSHAVSRRSVLKSLAVAGSLTVAGSATQAAGGANHNRIDVHHHYFPMPGRGNRNWTPAASLEAMEKYEIATAILSAVQYGDQIYDGSEKGNALARNYNEFAAKVVSDHPGSFGFLAVLPLRDQEASMREIAYAFDVLKADGVGLLSNTGDKWPGDPLFLPIFEELNRRKAVIFIHPFVGKCCRNLVTGVYDAVVEFDFDTTRAVTSLLYNGVLSRCPDIRVIVNHSGAAVPVLAGRIKDRVPGAGSNSQHPSNRDGRNDKIPNGVYYELRKLYYECAHATYPMPFHALTDLGVPDTQRLFGTDFPMEPMETTVAEIPALKLSPAFQRALDRENAERLFPRLKGKL